MKAENINKSGYRISAGASYYDRANKQYFSFYASSYRGVEENPFFWQAGWAKNDWNITVNEDWKITDQYRTFAFEVGYKNYSFGAALYTTDHSKGDNAADVKYNTSRLWKNQPQYRQGERIYSGLYLGYRNGNTINRVGIDSPFVGDLIQGGWHSMFGVPLFDNRYGPESTRPYIYKGVYDPFSLYGR